MTGASILFGLWIGFPLLAASLAMIYGGGAAARHRSRSASVLFGAALFLMLAISGAALLRDVAVLKAVILLTGVFAVAGVALGLRAAPKTRNRAT